ncbi:hypothetical protein JW868_03625 [Candidatus Woesearchaeota archaeon]|nr:hypothetical protein [Candidatus Woesearchaeota archaeon]
MTEFFNNMKPDVLESIKKGREYLKIPENIDELIRQHSLDYFSAGQPLGEEKSKEDFTPSLSALQTEFQKQLAKADKTSDNIIRINEKGEWMFTCGKDVFLNNITGKIKPEIGRKVWVVNEQNQFLGVGLVEKKQIRNLRDIGEYLRREK